MWQQSLSYQHILGPHEEGRSESWWRRGWAFHTWTIPPHRAGRSGGGTRRIPGWRCLLHVPSQTGAPLALRGHLGKQYARVSQVKVIYSLWLTAHFEATQLSYSIKKNIASIFNVKIKHLKVTFKFQCFHMYLTLTLVQVQYSCNHNTNSRKENMYRHTDVIFHSHTVCQQRVKRTD